MVITEHQLFDGLVIGLILIRTSKESKKRSIDLPATPISRLKSRQLGRGYRNHRSADAEPHGDTDSGQGGVAGAAVHMPITVARPCGRSSAARYQIHPEITITDGEGDK